MKQISFFTLIIFFILSCSKNKISSSNKIKTNQKSNQVKWVLDNTQPKNTPQNPPVDKKLEEQTNINELFLVSPNSIESFEKEQNISLYEEEKEKKVKENIENEMEQEGVLEQYIQKADLGDSIAQYKLGLFYENKIENTKNEIAFKWYEKSAHQGYHKAQNALGNYYMNLQEDITENSKKAFYWHHLAANQGNPASQEYLGYVYSIGFGIKMNKEKSFEWYLKAAHQGNQTARSILILYYLNGIGTKRSLLESYKWLLMIDKTTFSHHNQEMFLIFENSLKNKLTYEEKEKVESYVLEHSQIIE